MQFLVGILFICIAIGIFKNLDVIAPHLGIPQKTIEKIAPAPSRKEAFMQSLKREYYNPDGSVKKRQGPNGTIFLAKTEIDAFNNEVNRKFYAQELTNITLRDGTVVPLEFRKNGRICPRNGLPEMEIMARVAVLE